MGFSGHYGGYGLVRKREHAKQIIREVDKKLVAVTIAPNKQ